MTQYIAVFDIGTSSVKGALVDKQAEITGEYAIDITTIYGENGEVEQYPSEWWAAVKSITHYWWNILGVNPAEIISITFSGQIEDVIPLSEGSSTAILYSDTRAEKESVEISDQYSKLKNITRNDIHSSTPLAKLLWLEKYQNILYKNTHCFVFSAKDYIIYKITGMFVTDPTTAATTGMMNLSDRDWSDEILNYFNVNKDQLPDIKQAEETVGCISEAGAKETGFPSGIPVLCGSGDAGASTMGAGAVQNGDAYFYIGTTGWAAIVDNDLRSINDIDGIFNLAHLPKESNITIAPLLNAGNVHKWAVGLLADDQYQLFDELMSQSEAGSRGLLFLPYIHGERCPVHDEDAKGVFYGFGPKSNRSDMARSIIEGICFSYKEILNAVIKNSSQKKINVIGGGAKSDSWCQILSDILGQTICVPEESEYMTVLGAASAAFVSNRWVSDYQSFAKKFLTSEQAVVYHPNQENSEVYQEVFQKYLKIYPNMKNIRKQPDC